MDAADNTRADVHRADAPGTLLGAARQAQNLSVADVARQLKLSLHQVEALEAGAYDRLPGPVFVRGFIRNYARLLKIDPEQLLQSAADSLPVVEPRPAAPPSQDIPFPTVVRRRWTVYMAAAVVVLVALAVYEFYMNEPEPVSRSVAVPPAATPAPVAPASATDRAESPPPTQSPASETGTVQPPSSPPPAAGAEGAQLQPAAPAVASAQDIQPPADSRSVSRDYETLPKAGERQVRMVFDQESWVEIRDRSGKAIFSQLNRRGTEQRVYGRPPLAVIVGNSHGVKLTWDERPVNLAHHTKVDVARLTLE